SFFRHLGFHRLVSLTHWRKKRRLTPGLRFFGSSRAFSLEEKNMPLEAKMSLLRLSNDPGSHAWYPASVKNEQTLKLRRIPFDPGGPVEDKSLSSIQADNSDCRQYTLGDVERTINLPVDTFPVNESTAWRLVAERMEQRIHEKPTRIIPIT